MDQPRARRDLKESDKFMKNSLFYWFIIHTLLNYKLHQVCENQPLCSLIFAIVETTCIKRVDKKSWQWQSICIKPVDNLQQTFYHQGGASDANASWYRLDNCKVTSLQQTCRNSRVSGFKWNRQSPLVILLTSILLIKGSFRHTDQANLERQLSDLADTTAGK